MKRQPKTIRQHVGVAWIDEPFGTDSVRDGGPRYDVGLKDGWLFAELDPFAIRRTAHFRTVRDFLDADPRRIETLPEDDPRRSGCYGSRPVR